MTVIPFPKKIFAHSKEMRQMRYHMPPFNHLKHRIWCGLHVRSTLLLYSRIINAGIVNHFRLPTLPGEELPVPALCHASPSSGRTVSCPYPEQILCESLGERGKIGNPGAKTSKEAQANVGEKLPGTQDLGKTSKMPVT